MTLKLGDVFPSMSVETSEGPKNLPGDFKDKWFILFSHPADFTPVCTTELAKAHKLKKDFDQRGVQMMALSCDSVESHKAWGADVVHVANDYKACSQKLAYPIIADPNREIAIQLGMLDPDEKDNQGLPLTCRAVFIVGPDSKLKLSLLYPATTGRNFDEILRVIDSLQLTAKKSVATPEGWRNGDECMVPPNCREKAKAEFPKSEAVKGLPSNKEYLVFTKAPVSNV